MISIPSRIKDLQYQINSLVTYMELKIHQRDWHGVADSAMDIRDLEAKIEVLREINNDA